MKNLIFIPILTIIGCHNSGEQTAKISENGNETIFISEDEEVINKSDINLIFSFKEFNKIIDNVYFNKTLSDFQHFIDSFYQDTQFQSEHIIDNLEGKFMFSDYQIDSIIFRKNNWKEHPKELLFYLQNNLNEFFPNLIDTIITINENIILQYQYIENSGTFFKKYFCKKYKHDSIVTFKLVKFDAARL